MVIPVCGMRSGFESRFRAAFGSQRNAFDSHRTCSYGDRPIYRLKLPDAAPPRMSRPRISRGSSVAKLDLGTKRICPETGRKFYDLNKDPIVSPYTGKSYPLGYFEDEVKEVEEEEEVEATETETENEDVEVVSLEEAEDGDDDNKKSSSDPDVDLEDDDDVDLGDDDDDTFLEDDEDDDDDVSGIIDVDDDDDES